MMIQYYPYIFVAIITALLLLSIAALIFYKLRYSLFFVLNFTIIAVIISPLFLNGFIHLISFNENILPRVLLLLAPILYTRTINNHFHFTRDQRLVAITAITMLSIVIYFLVPGSSASIIAISHFFTYLFVAISIRTVGGRRSQKFMLIYHLLLATVQFFSFVIADYFLPALCYTAAVIILFTSVSVFYKKRVTHVLDQLGSITEQNKKLSHNILRLKVSNDQCRKILMEREADLYQLARHASLAELTTGIAHELTQPITGIKLISQNMIDDINYDEFDKLQAVSDLVKICSLVDKSTSIINHIRTFSRKSASTMKITDLNRIFLDAIDLINLQIKKNSIDLVYVLDDSIPKIMADKLSLEQLLINIILNAKDAIIKKRDGNPDHNGVIQITTTTEGTDLKLIIEDNGIGIPENTINKIWSPFYTTKKGDMGTGIGLSISSKILKDHNARVEVHSSQGGTIFSFFFPIPSVQSEG